MEQIDKWKCWQSCAWVLNRWSSIRTKHYFKRGIVQWESIANWSLKQSVRSHLPTTVTWWGASRKVAIEKRYECVGRRRFKWELSNPAFQCYSFLFTVRFWIWKKNTRSCTEKHVTNTDHLANRHVCLPVWGHAPNEWHQRVMHGLLTFCSTCMLKIVGMIPMNPLVVPPLMNSVLLSALTDRSARTTWVDNKDEADVEIAVLSLWNVCSMARVWGSSVALLDKVNQCQETDCRHRSTPKHTWLDCIATGICPHWYR